MSDSLETIWLQSFGEAEQVFGDEISWCEDQINDDDVEYIRADIVIKLLEALDDSKGNIEELISWAFPQRKEDIRSCGLIVTKARDWIAALEVMKGKP